MTLRTSILSAAAILLPAAAVAAPSEHGCTGLESAKPMAALEGKDGMFYRLNLDMRMNHPLSPETAAMIGRLSDALAARGTELIYVPVPTKSLAVPDALPDSVSDYGFDLDVAETAYADFLRKLRDNGVTTIDSMAAMRTAETQPFLAADFHWSPAGARAVAAAVAETIRESDAYAGIEKTDHSTEPTEIRSRASEMRRRIQANCHEAVPKVEVQRYVTSAEDSGDASGGIFAAETAGPPIALTGTSMSAEEDFHFKGFLADAAGAAVADYAITGGNQFGGITSYLLSEDFHETAPAYVIWENPVYNNIGEFGETPLRELIAAARQNCTAVETRRPAPDVLEADISADRLSHDGFVRADTGSATGRQAQFHFIDDAGVEVAATITRPVRYDPTRWFYQYAEPLWSDDLTKVRVELDRPVRDGATLEICTTEETQS